VRARPVTAVARLRAAPTVSAASVKLSSGTTQQMSMSL